MRSYGIRMGLQSNDWVPIERSLDAHTPGEFCNNRGRLERCVYKPRRPRIAYNHQKLGEMQGTDSPLELPEGTNPADTLI